MAEGEAASGCHLAAFIQTETCRLRQISVKHGQFEKEKNSFLYIFSGTFKNIYLNTFSIYFVALFIFFILLLHLSQNGEKFNAFHGEKMIPSARCVSVVYIFRKVLGLQ